MTTYSKGFPSLIRPVQNSRRVIFSIKIKKFFNLITIHNHNQSWFFGTFRKIKKIMIFLVLSEYFSFYFRILHRLYVDFMVISYKAHHWGTQHSKKQWWPSVYQENTTLEQDKAMSNEIHNWPLSWAIRLNEYTRVDICFIAMRVIISKNKAQNKVYLCLWYGNTSTLRRILLYFYPFRLQWLAIFPQKHSNQSIWLIQVLKLNL